jgi:hypothetical protein
MCVCFLDGDVDFPLAGDLVWRFGLNLKILQVRR